mgnify:CR=1 FL=1
MSSHTIPYTGKEKYAVIVDAHSCPSVIAHVDHNGEKVTEDKKFATQSGAIDYWFDQYYRGKVAA